MNTPRSTPSRSSQATPGSKATVAKSASDAENRSGKPGKPTGWTRIRENAEAVLIAIVLALIIRHFSLEAFEIPTGSMAPGLYGVHVASQCPNCDTLSNVGIETDPMTGEVRSALFQRGYLYQGQCPECGGVVEDNPMSNTAPRVYCSSCDAHVPADPQGFRASSAYAIFTAWCPLCTHQYKETFEPRDCLGGHKILVNKFLYQIREPRRWEVIVFKFNRQRNYIKRLIGLPGETIQVYDGDIWINGEIERKPEWAQDQMWQAAHDSAIPERGLVATPAWKATAGKGWKREEDDGDYTFNTLVGSARLEYGREIRNLYSYNSAKESFGRLLSPHERARHVRNQASVRDLRVEADVTVNAGSGAVTLLVQNGEVEYRCVVPAGTQESPGVTFAVEGLGSENDVIGEIPGIAIRTGERTRLDFYVADRQLVLRINGDIAGEPVTLDTRRYPRYQPTDHNTVGVETRGVGGRMHRVRVFRDLHYTILNRNETYACQEPFQIPPSVTVDLNDGRRISGRIRAEESGRVLISAAGGNGEGVWIDRGTIRDYRVVSEDGYFAMGDNSPSSLDSRAWGYVPGQNMLGRGFAIFWPALPWRWEIGFIR